MNRVDIIRNSQTGKEIVVSSVDLSDTVQGWNRLTILFRELFGFLLLFLALGPRYQPEDFDIQSIFPLEPFSSGLQSNKIC